MKHLTLAAISLTLSACTAVQQPATPPLVPANFAAAAQSHVNVPPDPLDALSPALRKAYLSGSNVPVRDGFARFYPYRQYQEPVVHCAPGRITEIVLGPNEHVIAATLGDTVRWTLLPEGNHVRVKPCPQGCNAMGTGAAAGQAVAPMPSVYATNLIIDTDHRTYHLKLQAGPLSHAMETLAFWYPEDIAAAQAARTVAMRKSAQEVADPPAKLNFSYRILGPAVPWRPIEAFDDGSHEYLLFASTAALQADMPALYAEQGKTQELVNYQARGNYYIVDRLYSDAALTQGVGTDRQTVRIQAMETR